MNDASANQGGPPCESVPPIKMNGTEYCGRCGAEPRADDDGWRHCDCCPDDCIEHALPQRRLAR